MTISLFFNPLSKTLIFSPKRDFFFSYFIAKAIQKIILNYSFIKQCIRYSSKKGLLVITVTLIFGIISVVPTYSPKVAYDIISVLPTYSPKVAYDIMEFWYEKIIYFIIV